MLLLLPLALAAGCHRASPPPPASVDPASTAPEAPNQAAEPVIITEPGQPRYVGASTFEPARAAATIPVFAAKADLSNLVNREALSGFGAKHRDLLAANGFVAMPVADETLESVYLRNAADKLPSLLTSDALLCAFDRLADSVRARLEQADLPALLTATVLTLTERCTAQLAAAPSPNLKDAARRNTACFAVAASLLGVPVRVEAGAGAMAQAELALLKAGARAHSEVFGEEIDYALYRPGTGDSRQVRYDAACQWLGLAGWHADAEQPRATRMLLLLIHALGTPPDRALRQMEALADTRHYLVGAEPARLAPAFSAAAAVYSAKRRLADYDDMDRLRAVAKRLRQPLVLLPRPARLDDRVLTALSPASPSGLPSGLLVMQALGQSRAEWLAGTGYAVGAKLPAYAEALRRLRDELAAVDPRRWESDLAHGRLWASAPLDRRPTAGWPAWQQSAAWADKSLLTMLAVWSASRHRPDGAEPGVTVTASTPSTNVPPSYVEPAPDVYARLAQLAQALSIGLRGHGLLDADAETQTDRFTTLCLLAKRLSETELRNESLNAVDLKRLAGIGAELATIGADEDRLARPTMATAVAALGGTKLWEAVGPVQVVYAVVPDRGKLYVARGALLSYHEFTAPALNDTAWRGLVADGTAPGQPEWAASYLLANPFRPGLPTAKAAPFPPPALGAPTPSPPPPSPR
ncbi:MAG: DUF3160 domain-containing protein [Armatimonadetes bacterium]|nr:DUF3160 domain-containing protein [Armatimonadota bacterium]